MTDALIDDDTGRFHLDALGRYGRHLTLDAPDDRRSLHAEALFEGEALDRILADHARTLGPVPDEVVAAHWAKHHVTLLVPGVLAAWTLAEVGLDASPANLVLHLEDAVPRRLQVRDPTRIARGAPGRDRALETLLGDHLAPLFDRLHERAGVDRARLWCTAGAVVAWLYDELAAGDPDDPRVFEDRARLLEADEAPWAREGNPLRDPVRYEAPDDPALPDRIPVRQACCLKQAIPGKEPCRSCPAVDGERRQALVRRSQGT